MNDIYNRYIKHFLKISKSQSQPQVFFPILNGIKKQNSSSTFFLSFHFQRKKVENNVKEIGEEGRKTKRMLFYAFKIFQHSTIVIPLALKYLYVHLQEV